VGKARAFQYGVALPADSDVYAVVPPVDESVLIVTQAAAVELANAVRLKVAKTVAGAMVPLTGGELGALRTYMGRVKDAGVRLNCTSGVADNLHLLVVVYYDPLVLDGTGARLDGTAATPVKDAVNAFLKNLPFNGVFGLNKLLEYVEATVEGVKIFEVVAAEANYASTPYVPITTTYVPDAGYMALDDVYWDASTIYVAG
jgi:hypothetical protein